MKLETLAVHAGAEIDAETGALSPPIHLSTTFEHAPDGGLPHGLVYQRDNNPTQQRLERALAALESGERALFYSTGMAAAAALLQSLPNGSHVLMQDDLYHGVRALAEQYFPRWGMRVTMVDMTDIAAVRAAITPETCCLWTETPSNPLLRIIDIAQVAKIAHDAGAILVVDATFATPILLRPLSLGADVVMHSATKYMGGHSDVMGDALIFRGHAELAQACFNARLLIGHSASPFAVWLTLRGLRSLSARIERHCRNARAVAEFLAAHPAVEIVHYPGLVDHPGHDIAKKQMIDFGGMLSVQIRGGRDATLAAAGRLKLFINATSLGGCESLIEHRASVEGAHPVSPQNLLRISVGLEHADDLIADLAQALA